MSSPCPRCQAKDTLTVTSALMKSPGIPYENGAWHAVIDDTHKVRYSHVTLRCTNCDQICLEEELK